MVIATFTLLSCRPNVTSSNATNQIRDSRLYTPCSLATAETLLEITVNHPSIGKQIDGLPLRSTNILPEWPDWNPSIGTANGTTVLGQPYASGLSIGYESSQPGAVIVSVSQYILLFDPDDAKHEQESKQEFILERQNYTVSADSSSILLLDQGREGFQIYARFCDPITKR